MAKPLKKRIGAKYWKLHNAFQIRVHKKYSKIAKTDDKMILFESMLGRNYSCNPKAIYEEMLRRGLDEKYKIYWIKERGVSLDIPGRFKFLTKNSMRYHLALAKARTWVFNTRQPDYVVKRKETDQIMTWHGTPLKKLALDMDDVFMAGNAGIESYKSNFWKHTRRWDHLIAPNQYSYDIFERCFDFHKDMMPIGYPRNDALINHDDEAYINALKEKWNLPKDKKIILYAPTWRDNESMGKGKYIFNPHINFDKLYWALKDEYVFIVKYHYLIANQLDFSRFHGFIRTIDSDITDLYLVSDIHMTDYSSTMFDYAVLNRPMIFYTYDFEEYAEGRGMYFDFESEAPGPLILDTMQLIDFLKKPDFTPYEENYRLFREKFCQWDDGHAAEKVVDLIEQIMQ